MTWITTATGSQPLVIETKRVICVIASITPLRRLISSTLILCPECFRRHHICGFLASTCRSVTPARPAFFFIFCECSMKSTRDFRRWAVPSRTGSFLVVIRQYKHRDGRAHARTPTWHHLRLASHAGVRHFCNCMDLIRENTSAVNLRARS